MNNPVSKPTFMRNMRHFCADLLNNFEKICIHTLEKFYEKSARKRPFPHQSTFRNRSHKTLITLTCLTLKLHAQEHSTPRFYLYALENVTHDVQQLHETIDTQQTLIDTLQNQQQCLKKTQEDSRHTLKKDLSTLKQALETQQEHLQTLKTQVQHLENALKTLLNTLDTTTPTTPTTPNPTQSPSSTTPTTLSSYKVQKGDSLGKIAHKFHTTTKKIKELNQLEKDTIVIGQTLQIPS